MKRSLSFYYFKSYLIVLVFAVVFMAIINFLSIKVMEKDTLQKNGMLLGYIKTSFDLRFADIGNLSFEIERNERNERIMKSSVLEKNDVFRLIKDLYTYKITNHLLEEIYIYYPAHNMVVTSGGAFTLRGFYKLNYQYDEKQFDAYVKMLGNKHFREYKVTRDIEINGKESVNLNYYHSFYLGPQREESALLGIKINKNKMVAEIDSIVTGNSECFAITDDSNRPVAYSGNETMLHLLSGIDVEGNDDIVATVDSTMISYLRSSFNGIRYISISGKNTLLKKINILRNTLVFCALFVFILDFLIAFYYSKKNEKPMRRIMDENRSISEKLKTQSLMLKNVFLSRLLKGDISDKNACMRLAGSYSIDVTRAMYLVLLVYIDSVSPAIERKTLEGDEQTGMLASVIKAALDGNFSGRASAEVLELDGMYTALLALDREVVRESVFSELMEGSVLKLENEYSFHVRIAAGSPYGVLEQTALSYGQSLRVMEELVRDKKLKYLSHSSLKNCEHKDKQKNLDVLSSFVNCVKLQDYANALAATDTLFSGYLNTSLPSELYALRKSAVVSILLDMLEEISHQTGGEKLSSDYHDRILSTMKQHDRLKEAVRDALGAVIAHKQDIETSDAHQYVNSLREYIDRNYANPDLGLYMIAEKFDINNSYLSKLFKKEFNIGVLQYINKIRIEKAKELLAATHMNIVQISGEVGYISDITFIRVFKRYEGTTPGKYREICS